MHKQRILIILSLLLCLFFLSCENYKWYGEDEYPGVNYGNCDDIVGVLSDLLGKKGQGGVVFYDKGFYSDGWRYLEVAPANFEFNAQWGAYGYDFQGTQVDIGTGNTNTWVIVSELQKLSENGRAAQLCVGLNLNGYNDWFLPSSNELFAIYRNLHCRGFGDFGKGTNSSSNMNWNYWSSSQYNSNTALVRDFRSGNQLRSDKNNSRMVRVVRYF